MHDRFSIFAPMNKIIYILLLLFLALPFTSCGDKVSESQIAAQVGNSVLTINELRMQTPIGLNSIDSAAFVKEYIEQWIDEHVMYEQGLRNLPNVDILNNQAEEYRRNLISQSYENELLRVRANDEISSENIRAFYDKFSKQLKLDQPIVQGVYIKVLKNYSKLDQLRRWFKNLNNGDTECMSELDEMGNMRAADYENFLDTWIDMYQLTDKLPETVVDAKTFLKCKVYEMKDGQYCYIFVIKDYRLAGEIQPYEFAEKDIYEILIQQHRQELRRKLVQEIKEEGMRTGFVKTK